MGEREREGERKIAGTWGREKVCWPLLLYVSSSPWACPVQIGLSQELFVLPEVFTLVLGLSFDLPCFLATTILDSFSLSGEALQIAVKRREAKCKGGKERYKHLKAEFQRIARRDKKAFLSDQCKEIEENNRMGKTRDLFKKIRDTKRISCKDGLNKGRKCMDPTETRY